MLKLSRNHFTIAAATAAAAIGGTAVAGAAGTGTSSSSSTATQQRPNETALTGTTKDKVQAAALAKVDGTVLRVETDEGGAYEAHIRKADGTEVEVKVSKDFQVTATNTFDGRRGGPGGRGHGGPGSHADLAAVAKKLGVTTTQLQSALDRARPADAGKDRGDRGADRAAALAKALGVDTADVQKILDANRPSRDAGGPGRGTRPDDSALISALAKGLNKSEADVKAAVAKAEQAHQAEHQARETAMYAAVAKALGKDTADVKAAFQAARPTR
jgi:hypothetical protein